MRDWTKPPLKIGAVMSVTVTRHVVLKTQLICGADVVTTFNAADAGPASATIAIDTKSRRTNKRFISFSLRYLYYGLVVQESRHALQKVTHVTGSPDSNQRWR